MKKASFFALFLVLSLGLSGCGQKQSVDTSFNDLESFVGSLNDLLNRGEAVKCSYAKDDNQGKYQGVFYIDGRNQKVRSDINMVTKEAPETTILAYSIMDKEYVYSWTNLLPGQGYKIKLDEAKAETADNSQKVDWDEKLNFSCQKWNVDNSLLELPKDITFKDLNSIIPSVNTSTNTGTPAGVDLCALCAQITDASAKAQCQKTGCQ